MKKIITGIIMLSFLAGCTAFFPGTLASSAAIVSAEELVQAPVTVATSTKVPAQATKTSVVTPTTKSTIVEENENSEEMGSNNFEEGINPLTGLPVENPENLALPPAMVSITNFPVSSRPQAGLSFSPFVFE